MISPTGPPLSAGITFCCWLAQTQWEAALPVLITSCEGNIAPIAWSEHMAIEDPELYHSMKGAQRFRQVCKYCMKHKRTCPVCAGVA